MQQFVLSRRMLIGSAFSLSLCPSVVFASRTRWSEEAVSAGRGAADACCRHQFVTGLADGSLARSRFLFYIAQNIHYLRGYERTLRQIASRLDRRELRDRFNAWADETAQPEAWTRSVYVDFGGLDPDCVPICPAAQLYSGWEAQAASQLSVAEAVAAALPCFWVYGEVGHYVARVRKTDGNPYADWLSGYGDPAYDSSVAQALAVGDELAANLSEREREAMTAAFVRSCRMEWMLFDAAWREETWPDMM